MISLDGKTSVQAIIDTGSIEPLFQLIRPAIVNNIDLDCPLGVSIYGNAVSQLRALEFQRPVIRATNTGLTALINHKAEVTKSLPTFTRGVLVGEFEGRTGLTPYAQWTSQWGLWPLWLLCGAIVLFLGAFFRRSRS